MFNIWDVHYSSMSRNRNFIYENPNKMSGGCSSESAVVSFISPFAVMQIKSHDFTRVCPWWVTTCFAAGGSPLHKAVFKPDLHSGTLGQILVPLKLPVRLSSHNHSHNAKHCCNDSKKTKSCSSLKTCFIHPRFNGLFASSGRLHIVTFCSV